MAFAYTLLRRLPSSLSLLRQAPSLSPPHSAHGAAGGVLFAPRSALFSSSAAADASPSSSTDSEASADKEAFMKRWRSVAPSIQVEPGFPEPEEGVGVASETVPESLCFSLYLPHKIVHDKVMVDTVLLPGTEGDFGVKPGHVPTIAQLRPGVMTVIESAEGEEKKYFVPAGFAVVHPNSSTEVSALEAVPLDELDAETIKQGLADYTAKLAQGGDEYESAVAQIGIEVYSALNSAVVEAK